MSEASNFLIKYEGTFKNNKKDGIGYLYFNNGEMFLGEFYGNEANGYGVYYKKNG